MFFTLLKWVNIMSFQVYIINLIKAQDKTSKKKGPPIIHAKTANGTEILLLILHHLNHLAYAQETIVNNC